MALFHGARTRKANMPTSNVFSGEALRAVAMPLGGLGTGTIALAGDGWGTLAQKVAGATQTRDAPRGRRPGVHLCLRAALGDGAGVPAGEMTGTVTDDSHNERLPRAIVRR
jgi:hypothetical protein